MARAVWAILVTALFVLVTLSTGRVAADSVSVRTTIPDLELTGFTCSPQPFDPTVGPVAIRFTFSRPAPAFLVFRDGMGTIVRTVFEASATAGPNVVLWDGRGTGGALLPPAWYTCTIMAAAGGVSVTGDQSVAMSYGAPLVLSDPKVKPTSFKPPATCTISAVISRDAMVSATVRSSAGALVRQDSPAFWVRGTAAFVWNGRSDAGAVVPAGTYIVTLQGVDSGGASSSVPGEVRVR